MKFKKDKEKEKKKTLKNRKLRPGNCKAGRNS